MLVSFANANPPIAQGSEWDHMDKFPIPKLSETVRKTDSDGVICAEGRGQKCHLGKWS